ncbi:MAG: helix-turn-helix domain-containing protein [Spirochaetia bacterium]|nr:helix-turn-helix domain-containing protein [Spirochaetia bacterium]
MIQLIAFISTRKLFSFWTSALLFVDGYAIFYRYLFFSHVLSQYSYLAGTGLNFQFLSFSIYFMVIFIYYPIVKPSLVYFLPALPGIAGEIRLLILQMNPEFQKKLILDSYHNNSPEYTPDNLVNWLYLLHVSIIILSITIFLVRMLNSHEISLLPKNKSRQFRQATWLILFLTYFNVACYLPTIPVISVYLPEAMMKYIDLIIISETFLYILSLQFVQLFFVVSGGYPSQKRFYFRNSLESIDLNDLEEKFNELLDNEKVYLEENLNITTFSKKCGYSYKVISQYLNREKGIRFDEWIAQYRIQEAIHLMKTRPEMNSTHIGLESGFNSTSSFYRVFKKKLGESPDSYRKHMGEMES